ncbi:hypothetical protein ACFQPC_14810 [Herminiimonas glaciei]|uniref:Lipoprotein n=1 Tax=Herminiimonas glaciei TaxID=523788 RepID=A0ABW2IEH7_9BURK
MKNIKILLSIIIATTMIGCSESQSSDKQAQAQVTFQTVIRQGATFCSDMRSMQKIQVMERINNPYVQMPRDCEIAPQPIPVQTQGEDPMGFVVVFNEGGRALIQRKDLETIQVRN